MAFSNLFQPYVNTSANITQLPASLLETFIPGYSIISRFLWEILGFDVTLMVTVGVMLLGLATVSRIVGKHASDFFKAHFLSFVSIDFDDLFDCVMEFLTEHELLKGALGLIAKSSRETSWDLRDEIEMKASDNNDLLNFNNWDVKAPPTFEPYFGHHYFVHKDRYFLLKRKDRQITSFGVGFRDQEIIELTCIERSTSSTKLTISTSRLENLALSYGGLRPKNLETMNARFGTRWRQGLPGPIKTFVLAADQKERILVNVNEYLKPSTSRWYANRGIPYRRGYLFDGPPGTGKSSLASAIAGMFGLNIYCLSLVNPTLTDEDIGVLFINLPQRCVILLEDIDSAGLIKRQELKKTRKTEDDNATGKAGTEIANASSMFRRKIAGAETSIKASPCRNFLMLSTV